MVGKTIALENLVNPLSRARFLLFEDFYQSCLYGIVLGGSDAMLCSPCYDVYDIEYLELCGKEHYQEL